MESKDFSIWEGEATLKSLKKNKISIILKDAIVRKTCCEQTVLHLCLNISVVVDLVTDCIWTLLFPVEMDLVVPVASQKTDDS